MCFWNTYDSSKTLTFIQTVYFFNQRMRVKKQKHTVVGFFFLQRNKYHIIHGTENMITILFVSIVIYLYGKLS